MENNSLKIKWIKNYDTFSLKSEVIRAKRNTNFVLTNLENLNIDP